MNDGKPWYQSKGVWGGLVVAIGAIYGYLTGDTAGATGLTTLGLGLWGIGIRAAL